MKKNDTSIEIKIENTLLELNIPYQKQIHISNKTVCNFFIKPNIIIYADGDYWHSLPDVVVRDIKINDFLYKNGYNVYRFSETEINTNLKSIKYKLNNEINKRKISI